MPPLIIYPLAGLLLIAGLFVSGICRRKRWAAYVWAPTLFPMALAALVITASVLGISSMHGPDAG